jgi:hypothetical protein
MGYGTTVDGISFYYPNQGLPDDSSVVAYPYTIGTYSDGPDWPHVSYNVVIQNCTFINPYQAVRMTGGFPFNIDNCFFSPAINAVYVDVMKDTSFITRCHVEPVWFGSRSTGDISAASMAYALANLIAYQVFRADSLCISDSMCFVAKTGLSLQASATPESGLSSAWFLGNNMAFDICDIGIDAQSVAQQGAVINNVTITTAPTSANNIGIRVAHSATGPGTLSVANSSICSQSGREIVVTGGRSRFTGCTFYSYGGAASGSSPSVAVTGGDVTVMGCDFADARPQMSFTGGGKAIFSNNTCGSNGVSVTGVTSSNSL